MSKVLLGNWLLVICSIFYLAWWLVTFKPPQMKSSLIGNIFLVIAFVSGLSGMFISVKEIAIPTSEIIIKGISGLWLILGGAASYILLLLLTRAIFHRQVTSELFIITGWALLEIAICNYMYAVGVFRIKEALILALIVLITALISLVCYILYYKLPYEKGYIDGCIPLVLCMLVMVLINLRIMKG